ncbi:hypothetical protein OG21DRAFT_1488488 [Imleria badia]|nr:hypothetical protein OG21DRAFT_1488488 [Imleria badia]
MAPSSNTIYWLPIVEDWDYSASDILNEQGLEEDMQKSAGALLMLEGQPIVWIVTPFWDESASDILKEQAEEEAQ